MRKIVFFIPAVIFIAFYGFMLTRGIAYSISPIVFVWIILFIVSAINEQISNKPKYMTISF